MFGLPQKTKFSKRIPKNKFYSSQSITPQVKQMFTSQVNTIIWQNKLSMDTVNLSCENIEEIEVFEIALKDGELDEQVIKLIDKAIPYNLVFVLSHDKKYKIAIGNKQKGKNNRSVITNQYFYSDWKDEVLLEIKGLSLDNVYENWLKDLIPINTAQEEDIEQSIERHNNIEKLKREIAQLETRMNKTKQFNKRVEINIKLKEIKNQLLEVENGL